MRSGRKLIAASLFAICLSGCVVTGAGPLQANPNRVPEREAIMAMVVQESRDLGFPAALALAVAHIESSFKARAESPKGARGVMQIMPQTARGEYGIEPHLLWKPRVNIRLGIHFLGRLINQYGRIDIALSHYNGGSAVGRPGNARVIPATRSYVRRVLKLNRHYRRLLSSRRMARRVPSQTSITFNLKG